MTTIQLNNKDKTSFNFKYDNDLPVKPIIECTYEFGYSETYKFYALSIYLDKKDIKNLKTLNIDSYFIIENKQLLISINDNYLIFDINDLLILEEIKNKKLIFYFFNQENDFLKGVNVGNKIFIS